MTANRAISAVLLCLVAGLSVAVQAERYDPDDDCEHEDTAHVWCLVTRAPDSVTVKPFRATAFDASTAFIDVSGFGWGTTRSVDVWVAARSLSACAGAACGFEVELCNDRDKNAFCTNVGDQDDQLFHATAGTNLHPNSPPCSKDTKSACDPMDAEISSACLKEPMDAAWGELFITVGSWVSAQDDDQAPFDEDNIGAGLTVGEFEVWLRDNEATCTPNGFSYTPYCAWERDIIADPATGTGNCGGGAGTNVCPAGSSSIIVVYVGKGTGSTTAAGPCVTGGSIMADASSTANSATTVDPNNYLCSFSWSLGVTNPVEAGACIVV